MMCDGKTALVTGGAGKGMGRSIALTLAREGANVVVNYRSSADSAAAIAAHIESRRGRALALQADVAEADPCRALVDAATEAFGRVDICIIGPGGGWHPEPIEKLDSAGALDDVRRELAPLYHLMPLVLPGMYERRWGRLIAIALTPAYNSPAYAYNVAKAARAQALLLARDAAWSQGVTLNTIGPGPVPEIDTLDEAVEQCDRGPAWHDRTTTSAQDIAESVAFLCSKAGDFISGALLPYMYRG
ncbi:MAG: SDR family oxidoreductase [Sedimentisphaerales bacterium]|nr:SDR family oxidoreductase [Sedimentisphaerales bacterium]